MVDNLTLVHMNGRMYDPILGRFISADPFVQAPYDAQSLNRYSYVRNNPLTLVDPSGFQDEAWAPGDSPYPPGLTGADYTTLMGMEPQAGPSAVLPLGDRIFMGLGPRSTAYDVGRLMEVAYEKVRTLIGYFQFDGESWVFDGFGTNEYTHARIVFVPRMNWAIDHPAWRTLSWGEKFVHISLGGNFYTYDKMSSEQIAQEWQATHAAAGAAGGNPGAANSITSSITRNVTPSITKVVRSAARKRLFLKQLAEHPNTPSWQRQWLREGRNPPGYQVDHIKPLSIGGADIPSNMRLVLKSDHDLHHKYYRPWQRQE
jgi:RHS repeat-associated protein